MKRFILCLATFVAVFLSVDACDMCGCAPGGGNVGILPGESRHFISIRYQTQSFHSNHLPGVVESNPPTSEDRFHRLELWGRWVLPKRWELFAFAPYMVNVKHPENSAAFRLHGLGDATLAIHRVIYQTPETAVGKMKHRFQAGVGLKLPTGRTGQKDNSGLMIPNLQLGSGSWDIPISMIYQWRYQSWGMFSDVNSRWNTQNREGYRFGHTLSINSRLFYRKSFQNASLVPQIGLGWDHLSKDKVSGKVKFFSGADLAFTHIGFDVFWGSMGLGLNYSQPLYHQMAEGMVHPKGRWMANIFWLF